MFLKIINKFKKMEEEEEKIVFKKFNFQLDDRIKVSKKAKMYNQNKFHPAEVEGTIVYIGNNSDYQSNQAPLYIVWDNDVLSANCLQDIELVEAERLKDRFTYPKYKLYFEEFVPKTVDEVLPHLYSGKYRAAVETFYKNEFGNHLHCKAGKLRSFDDIYYLFKSYFLEETHASVFERMLLFEIKLSNVTLGNMPIQLSECSTIKRIRYMPFGCESSMTRIWNESQDAKQYESFMHWKDLFKLLNINNKDQLTEWYKSKLTSTPYVGAVKTA
jgi:hypothetical protein